MDHQVFGGDIKDAYAHSPGPDVPTFLKIDDVYADWWEARYPNDKLDRTHVLPILRSLQGHPESGKIYERYINDILVSKDLGFQPTVHDRCI